MLDIEIGEKQDCEGFTRRDLLRVGGLTAFGLTLPNLLRAQSLPKATPQNSNQNTNQKSKRETACILLWMGGGPSHIDTFDPKPDAPQEFRGTFGVVETNVKGIRISDQLPKLAKQMDKFSILRSVTSPDATHETATHYLLTGYPFNPAVEYPGYGSVVAREKGFQNGMPPYAMFGGMPNNHGGGGYMGATYNPFVIGGDPNNAAFRVDDIAPPDASMIRMDRRRALRGALDDWQRNKETSSKSMQAHDEFYQRAYGLVTSPVAKKAFNIKEEADKVRDAYGRTNFGQACLLARRMVEAGVRCVSINYNGWDTHQDNFTSLKNGLLPPLDQGYSALLADLHDRGMLDTTLVVWMGEFGRTPRINSSAGRDHWSGAISVCMGGGGVKTGQVVGSSTEHGDYPKERPLRVEDVAATIYTALGINTDRTYMSPQERPIKVTNDGTPISELI